MTREQFEEAKRLLSEIDAELKGDELTAEQREKLEIHRAQLAGMLLRPWLPFSWWRRLAMFVMLLLGTLWPLGGSPIWVVAWFLMLLFSPRIMGETAFALGRFAAGFKNGRA
ncbi:MAG: hypothetical protein M1443_03830 [Nitrospirae bacterium]|nr:hypothetical protein [Nitrospirota bacterium]